MWGVIEKLTAVIEEIYSRQKYALSSDGQLSKLSEANKKVI